MEQTEKVEERKEIDELEKKEEEEVNKTEPIESVNEIKENLTNLTHSKKNIDTFLEKKQYKTAFSLLILVLRRLDENQKIELLDHYIQKIDDWLKNISPF
jgi:hypothetical protein